MRTFVVHVRRNPEVLSRVVLMLRRRAGQVELAHSGTREEDRNVTRINITIEADNEQALRIEANLYKLVDVLLVENMDHAEVLGPGTLGGISSQTMKVIYVITTGGTIEKAYSEQTGTVSESRQ